VSKQDKRGKSSFRLMEKKGEACFGWVVSGEKGPI